MTKTIINKGSIVNASILSALDNNPPDDLPAVAGCKSISFLLLAGTVMAAPELNIEMFPLFFVAPLQNDACDVNVFALRIAAIS